jgi:methylmalonyl-CoA/ethylmalonyl-CoA epimerase
MDDQVPLNPLRFGSALAGGGGLRVGEGEMTLQRNSPTTAWDHAAHAAPRIRPLLALYCDVLEGTPLMGGTHSLGFRHLQIRFPDRGKLELIEPLPGSTFLDSFFARNPLGGLHHITYMVDDVRRRVAVARARGFPVFGEEYGDHWHEAFIHPRDTSGVLIQFAWHDPASSRDRVSDLSELLD